MDKKYRIQITELGENEIEVLNREVFNVMLIAATGEKQQVECILNSDMMTLVSQLANSRKISEAIEIVSLFKKLNMFKEDDEDGEVQAVYNGDQ